MAAVGKRFRDALAWASELHEDQSRKGGGIPYIAHLLSVASIVLEHGGSEDVAIAALLHDTLEDQAHKIGEGEIRARFGDHVQHLVEACSDGTPEEQKDKRHAPWFARKEKYIADIASKPLEALMVSMADKLHNARSILEDYRAEGDVIWSRFTTGRDGTLWYYDAMLDAFEKRGGHGRLWGELRRTVSELKNLVGAEPGAAPRPRPQ